MEKTWEEQGGSAFPIQDPNPHSEMGISLRDYFAGQAISSPLNEMYDYDSRYFQNCAAYAYRMADAMLAERNKAILP